MPGPDTPLTPLRYVERTVVSFPYRVGVVDGRRQITWAEVYRRTTRLANAIRNAGVGPGERVMCIASNSAEALLTYFAVPLAGATIVATDSRLAPPEAAYILVRSEARLVLVDAEIAERFGEVFAGRGAKVVVLPDERGNSVPAPFGTTYADFVATGSDLPLRWEVDDEDATIAISYTSGPGRHLRSTAYTHRELYLNALEGYQQQGLDPKTRYLWTQPLCHCNAWGSAWAVTAAGGTHVCAREGHALSAWDVIAREGVTHTADEPHLSRAVLPVAAVN